MTRSKAREIALCCLFECMVRKCPPGEVLDYRLENPGLAALAGEDGPFDEAPAQKDITYIREVVSLAAEKADELFAGVAELSQGWSSGRITRMTRAILTLSMTEILYRDDVPAASSINEAVELAKKYDTDKAPSYINGILGSFMREKASPESENEPHAEQ